MTDLCKLAYKYRTDKCPQIRHYYTPFYHELFKNRRNEIKKVMEFGTGFPEVMGHVEKVTGEPHIAGASLYMWRDYFPNAQVYGADWSDRGMVKGQERIRTYLCDERSEYEVKSVFKETGTDIDIFVDDALHQHTYQLNLAKIVLPILKEGAIYIIEDVHYPPRIVRELEELGYKCEVPKLPVKNYRENLIIIRK
jgi:hypothetical protein